MNRRRMLANVALLPTALLMPSAPRAQSRRVSTGNLLCVCGWWMANESSDYRASERVSVCVNESCTHYQQRFRYSQTTMHVEPVA